MIAIADASPLCYLVLIGEIELLPRLFSRVFVPEAVIAELLHKDAPEAVRSWVSNLPSWICAEPTPERGLRVTGTLGVLGEAATRGLVNLADAIDRLRMTDFRCSPALLKATIDRFGNP